MQAWGWLPFFAIQLPFYGNDNWLSVDCLVFAVTSTLLAVSGSLILRAVFRAALHKPISGIKGLLSLFGLCIVLAISVDVIHHALLSLMAMTSVALSVIDQQQPLFANSFLIFFTYLFWEWLLFGHYPSGEIERGGYPATVT